MRTNSTEQFSAKDMLTVLAVLGLGLVGYAIDHRYDASRWVLPLFGRVWMLGYRALAAGCLYGAIRYRPAGWWWGMVLGIYLLLMPVITIAAAEVYTALVGHESR